MGYRANRRIFTLFIAVTFLFSAASNPYQIASADSQTVPTPTTLDGNVSCLQVPDPPGPFVAGNKVDGPSGTNSEGLWIVTTTSVGDTADFTSNIPVVAVLVKGGPNTNLFDLTSNPHTHGEGFFTPDGSDVSHVEVCSNCWPGLCRSAAGGGLRQTDPHYWF